MQLSAKRLLKPFTLSTVANNTEDDSDVLHPTSDADIALVLGDDISLGPLNEDTDGDLIMDPGDLGSDKDDHEDDEGDEGNESDNELLESMATIRAALRKVCLL